MEAQAIINADYLDILFHNRNKKYGGYAIRKYDDQRKVRALALVVACCATWVAFSMWPNGQPQQHKVEVFTDYVINIADIKPVEIIHPPLPPETLPEPTETRPTIENPIPVITHDELVTELPPPVDSFAGRESGAVTAAGKPEASGLPTTANKGTGTGAATATDEPRMYVDEMPAFAGNVYQYLSKSVRYPQQAIQAGIEGKVLIQFVVSETGGITNARVVRGIGGGCDDEALRVVKAMPAWKPGIHQGKPVKVYFTLPITFKLN